MPGARRRTQYEFATLEELNAFLHGVDEANGWLDHEQIDPNPDGTWPIPTTLLEKFGADCEKCEKTVFADQLKEKKYPDCTLKLCPECHAAE